jgi:hypothetical protein
MAGRTRVKLIIFDFDGVVARAGTAAEAMRIA